MLRYVLLRKLLATLSVSVIAIRYDSSIGHVIRQIISKPERPVARGPRLDAMAIKTVDRDDTDYRCMSWRIAQTAAS